jgi:uncharacterized membrane protein YeiH
MNFTDVVVYIGTFVFALSGASKARAHSMDIFGATVLAFITAYGGGTTRDLIIGLRPVSWINDATALVLVLLATFILFLFKQNIQRFNYFMFVTDAVGLGMFTVGGIEISLAHGVNEVYSLVMGVITATFGGLIADIVSNKIPALLKRGELYATAAAIGGAFYFLCTYASIPQSVRMLISVAIVVSIRFISRRKQIRLPDI